MYAIAFNMDIEQLRVHYGDLYNAYLEVRRILEWHHFQWQQGSVYFGDASVDGGASDAARAGGGWQRGVASVPGQAQADGTRTARG